ncbi:MAG: nucleotidyltransferase domain-containing protein [Fimbriimonadia bacterium]|nr:nucleotidyltransferase domain-containing protein [Fimbriimonadia bacterium]
MSENQVLQYIYDRLKPQFDIKRMVLFGSRAKHVSTSASDWDVLVIAESPIPFIERQCVASLAVGKRDFSLDLLVYTPDEALIEAQVPGSIIYWAEREGREFHAK